jgi:hypothetical protein
MHVDLYEKIWMWGAGVIIAAFLGAIAFATASQGRIPPSHVETIDPETAWSDQRFTERGVFGSPHSRDDVRVPAQ